MEQKASFWAGLALLASLLTTSTTGRADVVSDWNAIAVQATITAGSSGPAGRPNPTGVIDIAMVHAAIFDAVQAIEGRYEPYHVEIPGASGSPIAAAAKAARDVLATRFPSQVGTFDNVYQQQLAAYALSPSDPGVAVGARAAGGILNFRGCDGSFPNPLPPPFVGSATVGVWRPTPSAFAPMTAPWLGSVTPFTSSKPSQFRAKAPPKLTSGRYARDYNEVKAIGARNGSTRTTPQTDLAHFYAGNTLVMWNKVLRDVSDANLTEIAETSRLFALAGFSIADALIACWNSKTHYVFWRPYDAIREGAQDGNPKTEADPNWQPLINNPAYPDYTSGANAFAAAATSALAFFFDTDHLSFSITTTNTDPTMEDTRTYERLSQAQQDVVDARVYLGIHFRFSDEAARDQGRDVAKWVFRNFLRPVDHRGGEQD